MPKNMGNLDRRLRLVAVAVIAIVLVMGYVTGPMSVVLGVVAAVLLLTSLIGTCPAYLPFGLSTRGKK